MKKVGILTHYNVNNQGAQLQMYATYMMMEKFHFSPYVLEYNKNFDFVDKGLQKRNIITLSSIPYILKNFLFKKGIRLTLFNTKKYIKNTKFRKGKFKFANYATFHVDYAIVGADEVLSLENGINIMMFGHAVNADKMIYYAPSCGKNSIDDYINYHCDKLVASGLSLFSNLSARDEATQNLIEHFSGKKAKIVLDPVLLYDFKNEIAAERKIKYKYIIVYSYDKHMNSPEEISAIKKFAKENKFKIVSVGTYHKWCDKNIPCDCIEWLNYFHHAEFVITDTFHGAIASIINNRQCAIHIRRNLNFNKMSYLLKQFDIEDREINQVSYEAINKCFHSNIDYAKINAKLDNLRNDSINYLQEALEIKNEK